MMPAMKKRENKRRNACAASVRKVWEEKELEYEFMGERC